MLQLPLLVTATSDVPPLEVNNSSEEETDNSGCLVSLSFFLQDAKVIATAMNPANRYCFLIFILSLFNEYINFFFKEKACEMRSICIDHLQALLIAAYENICFIKSKIIMA